MVNRDHSESLRARIRQGVALALPGAYDVFSARLIAQKYDGVFCSGYGLSASMYGLPDAGYITSSDVIAYVARMRAVLESHHLLVDIDDGFGDPNVANNVVRRLETAGASAVMMEDQKRPKKCGHLDGKSVVGLDEFLNKLRNVLEHRRSMYVLARTDTSDVNEGIRRAQAFAAAGADGVMVEAIRDFDSVKALRSVIPQDVSVAINLIQGGKTAPVSLTALSDLGINIVIYSTPCLFTAHAAVNAMLSDLVENDGLLDSGKLTVTLSENDQFLRSSSY
jgi:2-methylisocitrate lyase-like PEP mutase family enzyme